MASQVLILYPGSKSRAAGSAWVRVPDGLPVISEAQYRTEVLTARRRAGKWVRAVASYGGTSERDEVRTRVYFESTETDDFGQISRCITMIEPSHWQALPGRPEDDHED